MAEAPITGLSEFRFATDGLFGARSVTMSGPVVVGAWLLAIGLHALILVFMYLYVLPLAGSMATETGPIHFELIGDPDGPGIGNAATPGGVGELPTQNRPPDVPVGTSLAHPPSTVPQPPSGGTLQGIGSGSVSSGGAADGPSIVTGPGGSGAPAIGIGSGGGDGSGSGIGAGGGFFGLPDSVGSGSTVRGARRIVFVVDRSGSMADTFHIVRDELKETISGLNRLQKFHVIFFSSGTPVESPPQRCVSAIEANKKEFFQFLEGIQPAGGTHPAVAMQRALSLDPELIYMLTDGVFDASLLPLLREWNRETRVKISTIAYVSEEGRPLLEQIAREHNGDFRFVSENDLP